MRSACVPKGGQTRSRARSASNRREPYNKNKNKSPRTHQQKKSPEMKTFRSFTMMREVNALGHRSPPSFSWWWGEEGVGRKVGASWCAEIWFQLPPSPQPNLLSTHHPFTVVVIIGSFTHTHSACRKGREGWADDG